MLISSESEPTEERHDRGTDELVQRKENAVSTSVAPGLASADDIHDRSVISSVGIGWQVRLLQCSLAVSMIVGYLNSTGSFALFAQRGPKMVLLGLVLSSIGLVALGSVSTKYWPRQPLFLVLSLQLVLVLTTAFGSLNESNLVLLVQAIIQTFAAGLLAAIDGRLALQTAFLSAVGHCLLGLTEFLTLGSQIGVDRVSGGSHPLLLGFASTIAIGLSGLLVKNFWLRTSLWSLAGLALVFSFGRASIIALMFATLAYVVLKPGITQIIRILVLMFLGLAYASTTYSFLADALSRGDESSLYSATGRTVIWSRVLGVSSTYLPFGIGVGGTGATSPEWRKVSEATFGQPTENSFLEVTVAGGFIALALLVAIILLGIVLTVKYFGGRTFSSLVLISTILASAMMTSGFAGSAYQSVILSILIFSFFNLINRPVGSGGVGLASTQASLGSIRLTS